MNTDIHTEEEQMNSTEAAASNHEDVICVEGSTKELCENPELYPVIELLKNLRNKFIAEVQEVSNKFDLDGSVKVVFSIHTRKKCLEDISLT